MQFPEGVSQEAVGAARQIEGEALDSVRPYSGSVLVGTMIWNVPGERRGEDLVLFCIGTSL